MNNWNAQQQAEQDRKLRELEVVMALRAGKGAGPAPTQMVPPKSIGTGPIMDYIRQQPVGGVPAQSQTQRPDSNLPMPPADPDFAAYLQNKRLQQQRQPQPLQAQKQEQSWFSGLGDKMGGLLDMSQPAAMGLLAAGASMLQDSGYSTVPKTAGQILGNSLAAGVGAYTSTQDRLALQKKQAWEQMMNEFDFKERVQAAQDRRLQRSQLKTQLPKLISSLEEMEGLSAADQKQLKTAKMLAASGAYDSALRTLDSIKPQGQEMRVVGDRLVLFDPATKSVSELYQAPKDRYKFVNTTAGLAVFDSENPYDSKIVVGAPEGTSSSSSSGFFEGSSMEAQMNNILLRTRLPPDHPQHLSPDSPQAQMANDYSNRKRLQGSYVDRQTEILPDGSTKEVQVRKFADGTEEIVGEKMTSPTTTSNRAKAIQQLQNLDQFKGSLEALKNNLSRPEGTETFGSDSFFQRALYNDASTQLRQMQQLGAPTGADLSLMAKSLSDPTEFFSMHMFGPERVLAQIKALELGIERDTQKLKDFLAGKIPGTGSSGGETRADTLNLVAPNLEGRD